MNKKILLGSIIAVVLVAAVVILVDLQKTPEEKQEIKIVQVTTTTSTEQQTALANPASVFCIQNGGTEEKRTTPEGEASDCMIQNQTCDEWALFRGECNIDGVSNTGVYKNASTTVSVVYRIKTKDAILKAPSFGYDFLPLKIAMSGSGARYLSDDGKVETWEHQGELRLSVDGKELFTGALVK